MGRLTCAVGVFPPIHPDSPQVAIALRQQLLFGLARRLLTFLVLQLLIVSISR